MLTREGTWLRMVHNRRQSLQPLQRSMLQQQQQQQQQ
jgi:hypothetical protein